MQNQDKKEMENGKTSTEHFNISTQQFNLVHMTVNDWRQGGKYGTLAGHMTKPKYNQVILIGKRGTENLDSKSAMINHKMDSIYNMKRKIAW